MDRKVNKNGKHYNPPSRYEIRQIDAWAEPEGGWTWNESYHLGEFVTKAADLRRAFIHALDTKCGIRFKRGFMRVACDDGSILEVQERKGGCPKFAAIPIDN